MRILIIEDEITLNRTLQEGLSDFGYQVDTAENYKDAEYFIDIRNYDLVLTDWMLPDGDGIELCKIVKNRSSRTAVVVLSARDDKDSEIEALKSGADDYIKKPFDFDILLARILLVVISMVPVIPFLIEPWGFFTSTSTLKLLVEAVALFDTKLSLLVIISPVASLIETL